MAAARTPGGRLLGSLKDLSGSDLGGIAIRGALKKASVAPEQVQYVIMGQALTAGTGQIPARQAAVAAGIPMSVPALSINKVCLSGVNAIALADQMIRAGEFDVIVAGGQESMSQAPRMPEKSRTGFKYGDVTLRDHMAYDGLHDIFADQAMGNPTESANSGDRFVTREEQDAFAAASHQQAAIAWKNGIFESEVVPVPIPQRKGDPVLFPPTRACGRRLPSSRWPGRVRASRVHDADESPEEDGDKTLQFFDRGAPVTSSTPRMFGGRAPSSRKTWARTLQGCGGSLTKRK